MKVERWILWVTWVGLLVHLFWNHGGACHVFLGHHGAFFSPVSHRVLCERCGEWYP